MVSILLFFIPPYPREGGWVTLLVVLWYRSENKSRTVKNGYLVEKIGYRIRKRRGKEGRMVERERQGRTRKEGGRKGLEKKNGLEKEERKG